LALAASAVPAHAAVLSGLWYEETVQFCSGGFCEPFQEPRVKIYYTADPLEVNVVSITSTLVAGLGSCCSFEVADAAAFRIRPYDYNGHAALGCEAYPPLVVEHFFGSCGANGVPTQLTVALGGRPDDISLDWRYARSRVDLSAGDDVLRSASAVTADLGPGADLVLLGDGADVVLARDGEADTIICGKGYDVVEADVIDSVNANCEAVSRI
jgi:hypothetical protein